MFRSVLAGSVLVGSAAAATTEAKAPITPVELTVAAPVVAAAAAGGVPHDSSYYAKCMFGGVLSCGLTHTLITPLDLVKCRMQTDPNLYTSVVAGLRSVFGESMAAATVGWAPTLIGYSMQGFCKFGFYEIFKDVYADMVGEEAAYNYRTILYLAASASAEVIADAALCPMESVKVRMQTSPIGSGFPTSLGPAVATINAAEGVSGFYKGLVPLWMRQVPYTMVKFACFERTVEAFYKYMFTAPKDTYGKPTQLGITFASGYIAGVFCAIVSHPADTIVSKLNNTKGGSIGTIVNDLGFAGLWRGLGARIVMIGTLTGLQWWIYDTFKTVMGLGTSGGGKK